MEAPLSERGRRQAHLAGVRLAAPHASPPLPMPDSPPFAIVHSPLERAADTARAVEAAMAVAGRPTPLLRPDPGFAEIGQGEWEGLADTEINRRFGDTLAAWRRWPEKSHAPGGESLADVRTRVEASLSVLLHAMADGSAPGTMDRHQVLGYAGTGPRDPRWSLIVGHGGVFRVVVCALLDLGPEHFWNFDFGLAAISVIEIRAGRAVLRSANLDGHLQGDVDQAEASDRSKSGAT